MKAEQSCKDEAEQCALISPKVGELSCSTGGSRVGVEDKNEDGKVQALEDEDELEDLCNHHPKVDIDENLQNWAKQMDDEEIEEDEYGLGQEATGKPRIPKGLRAPEKVSKKEKEEHCLTHHSSRGVGTVSEGDVKTCSIGKRSKRTKKKKSYQG